MGIFKLIVPRFWLTVGSACLFAGFLALLIAGVSSSLRSNVIDIQGYWLGNWPFDDAKECRARLFPSGRFEMESLAAPKYAGAGTWTKSGDRVVFSFQFLNRAGLATRTRRVEMNVKGVPGGLELEPIEPRGAKLVWKRGGL